MTFRPTSKEIVDHIEQRSLDYGSRNQYILSLVKADMGPAPTPVSDLDTLANKVAAILAERGIAITPQEKIAVDAAGTAKLKSLLTSIKNV